MFMKVLDSLIKMRQDLTHFLILYNNYSCLIGNSFWIVKHAGIQHLRCCLLQSNSKKCFQGLEIENLIMSVVLQRLKIEKKMEKICEILEVFNSIIKIISGNDYPTANLFLNKVYHVKSVAE